MTRTPDRALEPDTDESPARAVPALADRSNAFTDFDAAIADLPSSVAGFAAALGLATGGDSQGETSETDVPAVGACRCRPTVEQPAGTGITDRHELVVDASACPGDGDLASSPACRATVVSSLEARDVDAVRTRSDGTERTYADAAVGLLLAAGRFAERARFHDEALADRARSDPLAAARRATGRAGALARIAAESGLAAGADRVWDRVPDGGDRSVGPTTVEPRAGDPDPDPYQVALRAFVGPVVSRARVSRRPPPARSLRDTTSLPTGATARIYDGRESEGAVYHLSPVAHDLEPDATATLAAAYAVLAEGSVGGGARAAGRAVRRVADPDDPTETLAAVLDRHTHGLGVFEHLFADERVSDVVVSAPVTETPVRVVVDGERLPTNVRLTPDGAASLASRFRRESGRAFSRSSPTLDASVVAETGRRIRVAGVTAPASEGVGFAFRARDDDAWTLPRLVSVGSLPAEAAAFLSLAVERGAATIVAGTRGAGKTTLLGALLWELPAATRLVSIEDTPELPVDALREHGRDVQALHTDVGAGAGGGASGNRRNGPNGCGRGGFSPTAALRAALRLGDGALVVGEVRGEEAGSLYEAMRVGAHGHAVLGTIHGDSAAAVRERVVSDLGVPASSFGATDLVVTCARDGDSRYVAAVEEVRAAGDDATFVPLFERREGALRSTGAVERGDSAVFERSCRDDESYGALLERLERRAGRFDRLATAALTTPDACDRGRRGGP
ncbi:type II/IV secretion system ATPase subunit [Halobellus limi]|uniref:Type II secretion protein n=1 Tax=Halobellus limi TaxID=699433 RepID=A0A1H5YXZ8_9EURY|nr:type II/IV secretion system ATPase subunit [Halobellus limi]QCC48285.1 type II secretion protein [Halobellus limi]SEG29159.1 Type IV secretory pathway ATPase VirB11/Archaellum biosynthesis ATPase [Halobellus limi]